MRHGKESVMRIQLRRWCQSRLGSGKIQITKAAEQSNTWVLRNNMAELTKYKRLKLRTPS